jgi:hypothetical protein
MKLKNPNLPYLLLLVLPFAHVWLGIQDQSPGAAIVGPLFLIGDWIYGLILLWLLLSPSLRWRTRDRGLMALGAVTVAMWLILLRSNHESPVAIKGLSLESLSLIVFYSGPLIAFLTGILILKRHKYLREI